MYSIIKNEDGTFECQCRLQDGTEYKTVPTLAEAIDYCKRFASTVNGGREKLKKKHISYYVRRPVTRTELVQVSRKELE